MLSAVISHPRRCTDGPSFHSFAAQVCVFQVPRQAPVHIVFALPFLSGFHGRLNRCSFYASEFLSMGNFHVRGGRNVCVGALWHYGITVGKIKKKNFNDEGR